MSNGSNENDQNAADTPRVRSDGGHVACPSWCTDSGICRGDHVGKAYGTTATGGLPPDVDGPEAPRHNTAVVRAQHAESDDLPPGVALFGVYRDHDFQVDLTLKEASILLAGLTAAIDTARSD